jgi:hypothetical protein
MNMRKALFVALVFTILFSLYGVSVIGVQNGDGDVREVVQRYFSYLRDGDTGGILELVVEPMLSERKKLLEQNTAYPEFLRQMYNSAYMEIKNIRATKEGKRAVDVEIYLSEQDPSPLKTTFILKNIQNSWKLSEEISR